MVSSNLNKLLGRSVCSACLLGLLCASMPSTHAEKLSAAGSAVTVNFDSALLDGQSNSLVMNKVRITQKDGSVITADEARTGEAGNIKSSRWTLTGKVEIATADGTGAGDSAVVVLADSKIAEAQMNGSPATFAVHDAKQQSVAHGRASRIDYDLNMNTVRLSGNAWITYGENEFTGETVLYNIKQQTLQVVKARASVNPATVKPNGASASKEGTTP